MNLKISILECFKKKEKRNDEILRLGFPNDKYKRFRRTVGETVKIGERQLPLDDKAYSVRIIDRKNIILPHLERILKITKWPHLCIFESEAEIDVYVTLDKYQGLLDSMWKSLKSPYPRFESVAMECLDIKSIHEPNKLKKDWVGCIRNGDEDRIKKYGGDLWNELIPKGIKKRLEAELESDNDKIKDVWIFCECEDIDYLWEAIYLKETNLFWGDKFHIVRLPKICECDNLNFQIKQVALIIDEKCNCGLNDGQWCDSITNCKKVSLQKGLEFTDLDGVDCIHLVANIKSFKKKSSLYNLCTNALQKLDCLFSMESDYAKKLNEGPVDSEVKAEFAKNGKFLSDKAEVGKLEKNWMILEGDEKYLIENTGKTLKIYDPNCKLKFLFLDIRIPQEKEDSADYTKSLQKLKEIFTRSAEIWIDTTLNLPDSPSLNFSKDFYNELSGSKKKVTDVVTVIRKNMDSKKFCRLAYAIKGNPCTTVTWNVG